MSDAERIKRLLEGSDPATREEVFRYLRPNITLHPLETTLGAKAEIILQAIQLAGGLTLRMIRGVIAEAAFDIEVAARVPGWQRVPIVGNPEYDVELSDAVGSVRVQVKLQRSKAGAPMIGTQAPRYCSFDGAMYVVETQRTRGGTRRRTGGQTRPYRFGEFDLLAVALHPSTARWDLFRYTAANWLIPSSGDPSHILKYQPVSPVANDDWTDDYLTAVGWLRSGVAKTIRAST